MGPAAAFSADPGAAVRESELEVDFEDAEAQAQLTWLNVISRLTGLQSLTLQHFSVETDTTVPASCLAEAIAPLRSLTALLVHGDHIDSSAYACAGIAACRLPLLRRLHLPLSTDDANNACFQHLLAATHLRLTVSMQLTDTFHGHGSPDDAAWVKVAGLATELRCDMCLFDGCLRPLIPVLAAKCTLETLHLSVWPTRRAASVQALLDAAVQLESLRELRLEVSWVDDADESTPVTAAFLEHLQRAAGLTRLQF
eukprot:jgi/Ulvmu1/12417/UM009_0067.1